MVIVGLISTPPDDVACGLDVVRCAWVCGRDVAIWETTLASIDNGCSQLTEYSVAVEETACETSDLSSGKSFFAGKQIGSDQPGIAAFAISC